MASWRPATADDPVLAPLLALPQSRDRADLVIVEGEIATRRAFDAGWPVEVVLATEACARRLAALPDGTQGRVGSPAMLEAIAGFRFHRGCLAALRRPVPEDPAVRLSALARQAAPWTIVVAEALADPVNVGALARNARAFGASAVVLAGGADPLSSRAVRASMGHVLALPIVAVADVAFAIDTIAEVAPQARILAATTGPRACPLHQLTPPACLVLLVGAEGPGLSPAAIGRAHVEVTIPTAIDSLNVAAATAVLLWGLRQPPKRATSWASAAREWIRGRGRAR